ncbi:hypothetical protein TrVE_jg5758 [Triparma verrucosa]|uniref:EF-hand domain-containing protein n=1 Tax=Triparma verrucosa TaxID=1606542 RepID=A0A9W7EZ58_9STRA|nr:hypothetical protein TrVE_jg5758 [Triparma verrucosa]
MDNQNIENMNNLIDDVKQAVEDLKNDFAELNDATSKNSSPTNINIKPNLSINPETASPASSPANSKRQSPTRSDRSRSPSPVQQSDYMKIQEMTKKNPVTKNLFVWLRMMKLRKFRAERIRNDLANGYVVAEVLSKFFPAQISTHSFDLAIHTKAKKDNWRQVQKFFRKYSKFGEILKQRDIDILIDPTVGISGNDSGIHVLLDVYRFLFKCKLVPKLSSWGQGEMEEKSYKSAIGGWKAEQEAILGKDGRGGGRGEQRKIELTEAEKKRVEEAQKFMGYRLVLDLLGKIAEAMAKSPKFSKNNSSSMSAKAHINVSKIFNVFDVDMTKDIDFDEFLKVIRKDLNIGKKKLNDDQLKEIFGIIDRDNSTSITLQEFASFGREAQKVQKSGELDKEKARRLTEKAAGKDFAAGKDKMAEQKTEAHKNSVIKGKAAKSSPRNNNNKNNNNMNNNRNRNDFKNRGRGKEKVQGGKKDRAASPSKSPPPPAPEPPPPTKTKEEIMAINLRNQAQQHRRRTLRQQSIRNGPPAIAPLPGVKKTDKELLPGHGDNGVSMLVQQGLLPSPRSQKKSLKVIEEFHKVQILEAMKKRDSARASNSKKEKAEAAAAKSKEKETEKRREKAKEKAKEKEKERAIKAKKIATTTPQKGTNASTGDDKNNRNNKSMSRPEVGKQAAQQSQKQPSTKPHQQQQQQPTKPSAPKSSKAMTSPRGKMVGGGKKKEDIVEVVLKAKPKKNNKIIKKGGNKKRKKEERSLKNEEAAGSAAQQQQPQQSLAEQMLVYQQQQGQIEKNSGAMSQQQNASLQRQQKVQQQQQQQQQSQFYMSPPPQYPPPHPTTILEEGESVTSSRATLATQAMKSEASKSRPALFEDELSEMNEEDEMPSPVMQDQQGDYGGGDWQQQMQLQQMQMQQQMQLQQHIMYQQQQQQMQRQNYPSYSQQSQQSNTSSQQSAMSGLSYKGVQGGVQGGGMHQQQPMYQPPMPMMGMPPMQYQQQPMAAYPAYPYNPPDLTNYAQAAAGGGQFVAGVPVLHVLKTPRDPTQRLSGIDITKLSANKSPETVGGGNME